jgi:CrcB protein
MTTLWFLATALAGGLGAAARFAADGALNARIHTRLPLGTTMINIVGSFALGLVIGLAQAHGWAGSLVALIGTGFLGGFTTFSAAMVEAARRLHEHGHLGGVAPPLGTLAAGVAAAAAGLALGSL